MMLDNIKHIKLLTNRSHAQHVLVSLWCFVPVIFVLVAVVGCQQQSSETVGNTQDASAKSRAAHTSIVSTKNIVAKVNDQPIPQWMFDLYRYEKLKKSSSTVDDLDTISIINELVNIELVLQEARRLQLDQREAIIANVEFAKAQALTKMALRDYLDSNPITEFDIKSEYNKLITASGSKEYKIWHIVTKTKVHAQQILHQLNKGAKFVDLARQRAAAVNDVTGGELGWLQAEQMLKPFATAIKALKVGGFTKIPVVSKLGLHIIWLEAIRDVVLSPYVELRDQIRTILEKQHIDVYINTLRQKANIEIMR